jgi:hypothetical protein
VDDERRNGTRRCPRPRLRRAGGPAGLARGRCYSVARHLPRHPPPRSRAASTSGEADSDRRRPEGT